MLASLSPACDWSLLGEKPPPTRAPALQCAPPSCVQGRGWPTPPLAPALPLPFLVLLKSVKLWKPLGGGGGFQDPQGLTSVFSQHYAQGWQGNSLGHADLNIAWVTDDIILWDVVKMRFLVILTSQKPKSSL